MKVFHIKSGRTLFALFLFAVLLISGVVSIGATSTAHAQSYDSPAIVHNSVPPCNPMDSRTHPQCFGAAYNTTPSKSCPDTQQPQTFPETDKNNAKIRWTYSNNVAPCVHVRFDISALKGNNCTMYMYVPRGFATDDLPLHLIKKQGQADQIILIGESGVDGWTMLPLPSNQLKWIDFQSIEFNDGDSTTVGQQIGWGDAPNYGVGAICPSK